MAPRSVHEVFEGQAARTPDAIALSLDDERLTYRTLSRRTNQMGRYLQRRGVGRESLVAICADRSVEALVALLGTLKAGGAYVPLDPTHPPERLAFLLDDAQCRVVLTEQRLRHLLPSARPICIDTVWDEILGESDRAVASDVGPEHLAYVMYTSGSTGRPKGVEIPHRGIIRLVVGVDYFESGPQHRFLQSAALSFDASTLEIWGALLHGAELVLFPGRLPTSDALRRVIREHAITTMWLTATLFNMILDEAPDVFSTLRQLVVGGEPLSVPHIRRALEVLPQTQIINGYGPTENSDFSCCYPIPRAFPAAARSVPIGRPIGGDTVYILDGELQEVPAGSPGELYVTGNGLARGYRNRPELTAERFVPNPFSRTPGSRLYRTGDLARSLGDGVLEFLGRTDDQVKIRGFRIELGEVQAALMECPAVRQAHVAVHDGLPSGRGLVAYVVPRQGASCSVSELRMCLGRTLPDYMVPSAFVTLSAFPLTPNGKIDRTALPAPTTTARRDDGLAFVDPSTELERLVASVWREILGIDRVAATDTFAELGGTSLLFRTLQLTIEARLGRPVSVTAFFEYPTVAELARHLGEGQPDAQPLRSRIEARIRRLRERQPPLQ